MLAVEVDNILAGAKTHFECCLCGDTFKSFHFLDKLVDLYKETLHVHAFKQYYIADV